MFQSGSVQRTVSPSLRVRWSVESTTAWPSSRAASIYSRLCRKRRCFLAAASALRPCSQQLIRTTFSFPVPCFSRNRQPPIAIYFELCFSFILSADYGSIRPVTVTTLLSIIDIATKAHRSALVDPSLCKTTAKEQSTPTRSSFPVPTIVPTAQFCCFPFLPFFFARFDLYSTVYGARSCKRGKASAQSRVNKKEAEAEGTKFFGAIRTARPLFSSVGLCERV